MSDPDAQSASLSPTLSAELSGLTAELGDDNPDLSNPLNVLAGSLRETVHGYIGLQLEIVQAGQPVVLTALLPCAIGRAAATSLRTLLVASEGTLAGGMLVVWSTVPGSLVDLAADLGHARPDNTTSARRVPTHCGSAPDEPARITRNAVQLDVDLPLPPCARSGLRGIDELAAIHRATGVLIAQGHQPSAALDVLRGGAAAAGVSNHAWAVCLLQTSTS